MMMVSSIAVASSDEHINPLDCYEWAGQRVCRHDEGHTSGIFHTFDALKLAGDVPQGRKIHVFLPRTYETSPNKRYPVIYFNDGQNIFFPNNSVGKTWKLAETLSDLYAQRAIPEVITVAVYPIERDEEYTHAPLLNRPCCKIETYANYLAQTLKPFIDTHYRTLAAREHNAIVGSSHGGLAALLTTALHPNTFGAVASLSGSLWVGMDPVGPATEISESEFAHMMAPLLESKLAKPKMYLDWGLHFDGGFHNSFIEKHAALRGREFASWLQNQIQYPTHQLKIIEDPTGEHEENSWAKRLPNVLMFFFN
jgi:hypothetical protein